MNNNAKKQSHNESDPLDLDGLELLLDRAHLEIAKPEASAISNEKLVEELLNQLADVTELVNDTSTRLNDANERFNSLRELVAMQEKQMELLDYYQSEAVKVVSLEHQLSAVQAQLDYLRRPLLQKLFFWVK